MQKIHRPQSSTVCSLERALSFYAVVLPQWGRDYSANLTQQASAVVITAVRTITILRNPNAPLGGTVRCSDSGKQGNDANTSRLTESGELSSMDVGTQRKARIHVVVAVKNI